MDQHRPLFKLNNKIFCAPKNRYYLLSLDDRLKILGDRPAQRWLTNSNLINMLTSQAWLYAS
jgi:hypothetical protein